MPEKFYSEINSNNLILRDHLAIDRTLLANERTLLAYLRSGMALVMAGFTIINFLQEGWFRGVGIACLVLGFLAGLIGALRYRRMNKMIAMVRTKAETKNIPGA